MLGIPTIWTAPENLRELPFSLIGFSHRKSRGVSNFALVVWPSGIHPSLSSEDEGEVAIGQVSPAGVL